MTPDQMNALAARLREHADKTSLDDLIDFVCDEYAHPPQRQPLTSEQIKAIWWQCEQKRRNHPTNEWWLQFARAIERAHDIGEKK